MENIDFDKAAMLINNEETLIRDSERLRAILRYVANCKYSPDKEIILAIAGVPLPKTPKEVQE